MVLGMILLVWMQPSNHELFIQSNLKLCERCRSNIAEWDAR